MPNSNITQLFHSGKRLQKLRELQGLSILELASELEIEFSTLIEWENKGVPDKFIRKCIYYFEVSASVFTISINSEYDFNRLIIENLFPKNEDHLKNRLKSSRARKETLLDLSGFSLSEIPREIIEFHWVTEINLSNNQLKNLPSHLLLLENLKVIDVSNNLLQQIPAFLCAIKTLQSLNFKNNPLLLQSSLLDSLMNLDAYYTYLIQANISIVIVESFSIENLQHIDDIRQIIEETQPLVVKKSTNQHLAISYKYLSSIIYFSENNSPIHLLEKIKTTLPKKPCPVIIFINESLINDDYSSVYNVFSDELPKYYSLLKIVDNKNKLSIIFNDIQQRVVYQNQLPSVKFEKLFLKNIGVYEHLEITFKPDLTVLIGLNGAGKTTILKALTLAVLGSEQAEMDGHTSDSLSRIKGKKKKKIYWKQKGSICLKVSINNKLYENTIYLRYNENSEKVEIKGSRFKELFDANGHLINLVLGIGEQRNTSLKKPHSSGLEILQPKVRDLLPIVSGQEQACIANFISWLGNLALLASQGKHEKQQAINVSFAIFSTLMQESIQFAGLTKVDPLELWIKHQNPEQIIPLRLVSQGYQAVMGWIGYIIQRMFEAYGDALQALQQPAIIMIDEIDQLLHVKWQQKILNVLAKEFFPHTQWIITTHSPMVVAGLDQAQVIQLHQHEGQLVAEPNTVDLWSWQYGDIVRYLFDVSPEKPEIQERQLIQDISAIKNMADDEQATQHKERLEKLTIRLEKVRKSRAFIDELYAEQQKLREREQELATLIQELNQSSKA